MEKINNYLDMNPKIIQILNDNNIDLYDNGNCELALKRNDAEINTFKLDFTDLDLNFYKHELDNIDITAYKINEISFLKDLEWIFVDMRMSYTSYVNNIMRQGNVYNDDKYIEVINLVKDFANDLGTAIEEINELNLLKENVSLENKSNVTAKDVFKMFEQLDEKEAIKFFFAYQGFSVQDGDDWITDPNNSYIEKMAEYYVTNERKWKNCDGFINRELIDYIQYEFHKSLGVDDIDEAVEKLSKNDDDKYAVCFEFHADGEKAEHGEDDWESITNDVECRESTLLDSVKSALSQICDNEFHDGELKNVLMSIDEENSLIKLCDTENKTLVLISKLGENEEIWERNYDEHMSNEYDDFEYEIKDLADNKDWQKLDIQKLSDLIAKTDNINRDSADLKSFCKEIDSSFKTNTTKKQR